MSESLVSKQKTYTSQELIALEDRHGAHNYHPLEIVITRGEGVWVWDVDGNRYLDALAAYSAVNQGHCHPRLVKALTEQAHRLTLCSRAFRNDQLGRLCEEISQLTGFERFLPMNSGAEAVETAIKLARKWGQTVKGVPAEHGEILVFDNNFHGRTTTIVGFSSNDQYRDGFGPYAGGYRMLPFGDADAVAAAFNDRTIAVLVEPIQGEGGVVIPPEGFIRRLRELTTEHRALLISDEIQSGLGRTGALFAYEHDGIRPDLVTVGKALSGGCYPVSGLLADSAVMEVFKPGDHGSTFGGNPLGAAVAREALKVLIEEKMIENSARQGSYAIERLRAIPSPHVHEVRGRGLWIGVELKPEAGGARRFCEQLATEGILCKETHTH
ncbi:MAG: ornithine--oxo-acid transaminase, partial [Thermoanaerobaculia bacterium]